MLNTWGKILYFSKLFFFLFPHVVQTVSGAHLASYPMGTIGSIPGSKTAGA
jgi:hypothetical protein